MPRSRTSWIAWRCLSGGLLALSLSCSGCATSEARTRAARGPGLLLPAQKPAAEPADPDELRAKIVDLHNAERAEQKLRPLRRDERLDAAAQGHAKDMAARKTMSHEGGDGSSAFDRIKKAGYRYTRAGENVAFGHETPEEAMSAWMDSPPHKKNVMGKYSQIGAGYAVGENGIPYWCVTFGTPFP